MSCCEGAARFCTRQNRLLSTISRPTPPHMPQSLLYTHTQTASPVPSWRLCFLLACFLHEQTNHRLLLQQQRQLLSYTTGIMRAAVSALSITEGLAALLVVVWLVFVSAGSIFGEAAAAVSSSLLWPGIAALVLLATRFGYRMAATHMVSACCGSLRVN